MKTYWASLELGDKDGTGDEVKVLEILYASTSDACAARDALRFSSDREQNLEGWKLTALKLGLFKAHPITSDGRLTPPVSQIFEWKREWIGTVEDWIKDRLEG